MLIAWVMTLSNASATITNLHYSKGALSGRKSLLGSAMELDVNCRLISATPPRIIDQPQHGTLFFSRSYDYPVFNQGNPHYKCRLHKYSSVRIYYKSEPGYVGPDRFEIEDLMSQGDMNLSTFDIIVQ